MNTFSWVLTCGNFNSFGHNEKSQFLWNMAAQRKFLSQIEHEKLLKKFIDQLI